MNPRRSATVAAVLCGTGGVALFAGFGSAGIENTAAPTLDRLAPLLSADFELADAPQPTAMGNAGIGNVDVARDAELVRGTPTDRTAASDEPKSIVESALTNSSKLLPPETSLVQVATFQRAGDDLSGVGDYEFYRWWSNPASAELTNTATEPLRRLQISVTPPSRTQPMSA
jgi:hypothetical protein